MNDDRQLDDLASPILDGEGVDWKAVGSGGAPDDEAMLAELKVLADIVELFGRDRAGTDPQPSLPATGPASAPGAR